MLALPAEQQHHHQLDVPLERRPPPSCFSGSLPCARHRQRRRDSVREAGRAFAALRLRPAALHQRLAKPLARASTSTRTTRAPPRQRRSTSTFIRSASRPRPPESRCWRTRLMSSPGAALSSNPSPTRRTFATLVLQRLLAVVSAAETGARASVQHFHQHLPRSVDSPRSTSSHTRIACYRCPESTSPTSSASASSWTGEGEEKRVVADTNEGR